jgi:hypothetical protein
MEHIARQDTPELFPMERDVWDAGGNKMNVMGKGMFTFQISNFQFAVKAAVAELNVDGIIGLDFLTEHDCSVDLRSRELIVGRHTRFTMEKKGHFGCFRVVTLNTVTIPAGF